MLTTIEVDKVLKDRIGADFKRYTILGACNPHFAFEALQMEEHLGALLPCNVVIIDKATARQNWWPWNLPALLHLLEMKNLRSWRKISPQK